jgi:hypothetical protein
MRFLSIDNYLGDSGAPDTSASNRAVAASANRSRADKAQGQCRQP